MSNINTPFDIRQLANEILGTALPPTPDTSKLDYRIKLMIAGCVDKGCTKAEIMKGAEFQPPYLQAMVSAYADELIDQRMCETDR